MNFFAKPKSKQIECHYKKFRTGDFFFNWIWDLNIVFDIKEVSFPLIQKHISLAQFSFGANYKLFDGLSFSKKHLSYKNSFAFYYISLSQFSLPFLILQSFQLFSKTCLGLWVVFRFLKFLICFRVRLLHCSLALDVPIDARRMMPYWHYVQSWLILLINFIQFLELIFVNKFTFSSTTWKKNLFRIYCMFYSIFLPVLLLNFIII